MVSRQAREAERRRSAKAAARFERAAKIRRERQVVAIAVVVGLVLALAATGIVLTSGGGDTDPTTPPAETSSSATESPSDDTATDAESAAATDPSDPTDPTDPTDAAEPLAALPTTHPRLYDTAPPATDSLATTWTVTLETNQGDVVVELDGAAAPQAVSSFLMLAGDGYFDGTACHRLVVDALLQCGDPTATGTGGPGYSFGPIENAPEDQVYPTGTLAMARQGGDGESMGSQFFLVYADVPLPDDAAGGYTVFGTVVQGLDLLQSVGAAGTETGATDGRPATDVIIEKAVIS